MFWDLESILSHAGDFISCLGGMSVSSHYAFLRVLFLLASVMTKGGNVGSVGVCMTERIPMLSSQSNSHTSACKACDHL